jgi:hypothetical protein
MDTNASPAAGGEQTVPRPDKEVLVQEFASPRAVRSAAFRFDAAGYGPHACPTADELAIGLRQAGEWLPVAAEWEFGAEYRSVALAVGWVWARATFPETECDAVRLLAVPERNVTIEETVVNGPALIGERPLRWSDVPQANASYWPWKEDLWRVLPDSSPARQAMFPMVGKAPMGRPDSRGQDACVLWNGAVVLEYKLAGAPGALVVSPLCGDPPHPPGLNTEVTRRLVDGWMPAVISEWREDGLAYRQTSFIDLEPAACLRVRLEIRNISDTDMSPRARYETVFRAGGGFPKPLLETQITRLPEDTFTTSKPKDGPLAPDETTEIVLAVPLVEKPSKETSYDDAFGRFREGWEALIGRGARVRFPDQRLNDLWRDCIAQLWLALDDEVMSYGIYPSIYDGEVFGVEEGWSMLALAYAGYARDAERFLAKTYLTSAHLDKSSRHHQYRNGITAQYTAELFRLTGDIDWLRSHQELLKGAAEWTIAQTAATAKDAPAPHAGLLPKYNFGGDLGYPAYSLYSNATCWRGLRDTAVLMKALGDPDAARYETAAAEYRKRILDSWDAAYRSTAAQPFLPFQLYEETEQPQCGDYYQLFAPLIFETGILPRRGKEYRWVEEYIEKTGRLVAGQGRFGPVIGLDAHYTTGYLLGLLQERRRNDFLVSLYGHLALSMDPAVYSMPEVMPLFTSAAQRREMELIRLTDWRAAPEGRTESWTLADPCTAGPSVMLKHMRAMLLLEELDQDDLPTGVLLVLAGVPDAWFDPGKAIEALRMPSFYGPISISCVSGDDVRIHIEAPQGSAKGLRTIELPMPAGGEADVIGASHSVSGSTLTIHSAGAPVDVTVRRGPVPDPVN